MALTRITQGVIKPNENYDTHNINSTGIITATGANISGNMSVGGVLTYEDVTNIDSIGIITARSDIKDGSGVTITPAGAGSYAGIVTALNFVKTDGTTVGGAMTGYNNDPGENNVTTFIAGRSAGNNIQLQNSDGDSAHGNVLIGDGAGKFAQNQYDYNVSVGSYAHNKLRDGSYNIAIGYRANPNVSTQISSNTIAIGYETLANFSGGGTVISNGRNTVIGHAAAGTLQSGGYNLVIGYGADVSSASVSNECTIGAPYGSSYAPNHLRVPGIGVSFSAGGAVISGIVTAANFAKADGSPVGGITGIDTTGTSHFNHLSVTGIATFSGTEAIFNRVSFPQSGNKTIVGNMAGGSGPTGTEITVVGYGAGYASSGDKLTAIGRMSGKTVSGSDNTCIGYESGYSNQGAQKNVFVGKEAGYGNKTGSNNIVVGSDAGEGVWNNANYSNSVILGCEAGAILTSSNSNVIVIGYDAEPSSNSVTNEITLGNSSITTFRIPGLSISIDSTGISDAKGNLRSIPQQNEQGSTHTLVAADAGKHILADNTVTVPPTSGIFSAGDAITIVNAGSSDISIAKGSGVTLYNSADGSDAGRTLAAKGMATILCGGSNTYYISGAGLS